VIRDLVDRRAFSWSELLGRLEGVVPAGIRLVSIAPTGRGGDIEVAVNAVGEAVDDGLEFLQALQEGNAFEQPFLSSVSEGTDGIDFAFTMVYVPGSRDSDGDAAARASDGDAAARASNGDAAAAASEEERDPGAAEEEPDSPLFEEAPEDGALDDELDAAAPGGAQ
jgi:hypothetical protein